MTHDQLDRLRQERAEAYAIYLFWQAEVEDAENETARRAAHGRMEEARAYFEACSEVLINTLQQHLAAAKDTAAKQHEQ